MSLCASHYVLEAQKIQDTDVLVMLSCYCDKMLDKGDRREEIWLCFDS